MNRRKTDLPLDVAGIKNTALVIRALDHPIRQRILLLLHERGRQTVSELQQVLHEQQPVLSNHLATLHKVGVVDARRNSRSRSYFLCYERIHLILKSIYNLVR